MKKQLLAMTLAGATLLSYAQSERKPAQEFNAPKLVSVESFEQNQDPKQLIKAKLQLTNSEDLSLRETSKDKLGFTHNKYQIYYKGLEVFGSKYTVHMKNGQVSHMTGNYAKVEGVDLGVGITSNEALTKAAKSIEAKEFSWDVNPNDRPKGKLLILDAKTTGTEARLAYKLEVTATRPFQKYDVFVDANTGEVLVKYSKIHFADAVGSAATRYSGTQSIHTDSYSGSYRLRDYTRGGGVVTWDGTTATSANNTTGVPIGSSEYTDNDNNWTAAEYHNSSKDDAGLDAHFAAGATYDFFYDNFGRSSYDGSGATINGHVNISLTSVYGYGSNDNAFWNGSVMVYGKGSSYNPLTTVDITGHEIGHAYMEHTAGLVYQKESGAMNESFSDIWGTCVENFVNVNYGLNKDLWNLGSEIGTTFRSMSSPKTYGQPDTYQGTNWVSVTSCSPSNNNDQCGVHTNSGVGNHYFYILVAGKSGTNDKGNSYNVTGIGIDKAAAINWRTESQYLTSTSTYSDWRTYAIQSAKDLYGAGSAEEIAVTNAWYAVGVGAAYQEPIGCVASPLSLVITFDNYPEETSWTVKNSGGTTVASGGTYGSQADGSTLTVPITLSDGDYTFTINDAYGDGICCSYGSGTYTLSSGSTTIVTGGSFGSSESTNFCVSSGPDTQAPTSPSSLASANIGQTSVDLSWSASTDNVGVTGYKIYRGSTNISTVTGTSTTVTGLTSGTSYSFHVTAVDAAGNESTASNTVNVTTLTPDTQAPSVPTGLSSSNVTQTSLTLSWSASSDNVGVTGYDVYQGTTLIKSVTGTSTSVSGLSANTTYSFKVRAKDAAGNTSAQSSALSVTTLAQSVSYCTTGGTNTNYEYIDLVKIGSINKTTGSNGGYADFTSLSTTLVQGSSNTINFSAGFSGSSYTENWKVWIDFNQDGDFADSGEQVVSGTTSNASTYSATVAVPSGASLGSTRMRVSMKYGSAPSSCGSFTYGEVEDYTINISATAIAGFGASNDDASGLSLGEGISTPSFDIYPNPTKDVLNINLGEFQEMSNVRILDLGGKEIRSIATDKRSLNVSDLKPGLYLFEIQTERGKFQSKFIKQ